LFLGESLHLGECQHSEQVRFSTVGPVLAVLTGCAIVYTLCYVAATARGANDKISSANMAKPRYHNDCNESFLHNRSITENKNAVLIPNKSIPSAASVAPIIRQWASKTIPDAPRVVIESTE
jgi:hypothetical protein